MNTNDWNTLLGSLSGHLVVNSLQQEQEIERLHNLLSRSLFPEDSQQVKGSSFAFENADLFSPEQIPSERLDSLRSILERTSSEGTEPEFRVFVREVPVRSTQLYGSLPLWAGGAAVDRTIGPFAQKDGRLFWFDFFRIERLAALYIQGKPDPALLFKVSLGMRFIDRNLPLITEVLPAYSLPTGSIWINGELLAANAPSGYYVGLTIQGGSITLSTSPQLLNGKLTISPNTSVTVKLQLRQPDVTDADTTSVYGIDARNLEVSLPKQFNFHFSGQGSAIDEVGNAQLKVYGDESSFKWNKKTLGVYDNLLHRILIPCNSSKSTFTIRNCQSPFYTIQGDASIVRSAWAILAAPINILNPNPATGIGGLVIQSDKGLANQWQGLKGGEISLKQPYMMAEPGRISITDLTAGNSLCQQTFKLWKDEQNKYGTSVELQYPKTTPFFYNTFANGNEFLAVLTNADVQIDRPVTVASEALAIHSKNSLLLLGVNKILKLIYLLDDNILFDSVDGTKTSPTLPKAIAFALHNALFKVTPVNGCLLFGQLADDFVKVKQGFLFLTFGLYAYLPTLPDPYAANLGSLKYQFRSRGGLSTTGTAIGGQTIWLWLVCQIQWQPSTKENDQVDVSFHFAPLQNQFQVIQADTTNTNVTVSATRQQSICETLLTPINKVNNDFLNKLSTAVVDSNTFQATTKLRRLPDYQEFWDGQTQCLQQELFALLDVSTNADLLGISFAVFSDERTALITTHVATSAASSNQQFPLQVRGMDVISRGNNIRTFTVPQISWEPVFNLPLPLNPLTPILPGDPPVGFNYYPNDGGSTRIYNNSGQMVSLAPIPVSNFIIDEYKNQPFNIISSLFTLPFGMRALAVLNKFVYPKQPPSIQFNQPEFENNLTGGLQLQFNAGKLPTDDFPLFNGGTMQINNVLDVNKNQTGSSTLGQSVSLIFNEEFYPKLSPSILVSRGVPLTRIDFCGYGASIFSSWFNPLAQMAQTSQSKFDVWIGRTANEVIQVKSIIYPGAIRVVRTIVLYRSLTGYVYRVDTGWKPESDGKFDFSYYIKEGDNLKGQYPDYQLHPGVIKGFFNIKNIVEQNIPPFKTITYIHPNEYYLDDNNFVQKNTSGVNIEKEAILQMVFFDADVEIENVVQGQVNGRVPAKKIVGFVQLAPRGIPLSKEAFKALLSSQLEPIGGSLDCIIDIGKTGQQMRLNRFDVNNSFAENGSDPIFVAAARGNIILPKEGSWSMIKHQYDTGEVTPVPEQLSVPLIRIGKLVYKVSNIDSKRQKVSIELDSNPADNLLRIAEPTELLRTPVNTTINYGFLLSTDTQKALFLTPSFKQGISKLFSKTPPLFVDAFRIVNSKAIFPNIGNAVDNFGGAISLVKRGNEFTKNALKDGGKQVLELMQINPAATQGYKLLRGIDTEGFDLPNQPWKLIEIGTFKIYIEYKANNPGKLNFDVDSSIDKWKSQMKNIALVVDLGPIKRLMTIKGNWNAKKGAEAQYKGNDSDPDFPSDLPSPQIEFSPELKPVIEILQILQDLQGENYKDAFQKGLKLAMSNKAGSWEYKFEAAKEIPVVRFPTPDFAYNDPNAPLKLEAGLKLGAYFNAALKVTTDPKQLLPTAGGYLEFYGRLSVMCVSLSVATVYAIGQVNLRIAADTQTGPSLTMKFGFGAQLVVGLPVIGNVSVLYVVGVEIYADSVKLNVSAFLLYQGHAELLGGIVSVTITIEAKGTISRANDRTDLAAQITFGLDISIFLVIDISFSESWQEQRQIA